MTLAACRCHGRSAWDALGEQAKADYFADMSARNPARRIGAADDIANGVLLP